MQARYYDPVIGRFYSNDPVDAMGHFGRGNPIHGFNRYTYANNNPYKYVDPDGKFPSSFETTLRVQESSGNLSERQQFFNDASSHDVMEPIANILGTASALTVTVPPLAIALASASTLVTAVDTAINSDAPKETIAKEIAIEVSVKAVESKLGGLSKLAGYDGIASKTVTSSVAEQSGQKLDETMGDDEFNEK